MTGQVSVKTDCRWGLAGGEDLERSDASWLE